VHNVSERPAESEALAGVGVQEAGMLGFRNEFCLIGTENCE